MASNQEIFAHIVTEHLAAEGVLTWQGGEGPQVVGPQLGGLTLGRNLKRCTFSNSGHLKQIPFIVDSNGL